MKERLAQEYVVRQAKKARKKKRQPEVEKPVKTNGRASKLV